MKAITNRTEIATIINSRSMPIVRLDLADSNDLRLGDTLVTYKWEYNGKVWFSECRLQYFSNKKNDGGLLFSNGGTCLHSSFGYEDIEELLAASSAPCVELGKEFLLVIVDSEKKVNFPPMILKMDSRLDKNCMNPIKIDENDAKKFGDAFGFIFDERIENSKNA